MNYIIVNNKFNLQNERGIGIKIPFDGTTGLNITLNTKDSLRSNILNFLLTRNRERILNPKFGSSIGNELFENITQNKLDDIKDLILNGISQQFNDITISEISITPNDNKIDIYFKYNIINTNIQDDIQINFDR